MGWDVKNCQAMHKSWFVRMLDSGTEVHQVDMDNNQACIEANAKAFVGIWDALVRCILFVDFLGVCQRHPSLLTPCHAEVHENIIEDW